MPSVNQAQAEV
ncbi:hypothetical protein F383_25183 [Gossypium arboreum]|nr:hypothetical protein F383_25183 [Gossypium arboreum]